MNGKNHIFIISIVLIGLWILFGLILNKDYFTITIILPSIILTLFPDIDQNFSMIGHRSIFTHNVILWIIIFYFNPTFLFILFILSTGIHCLLDCRWQSEKRRGFYTIKILQYPAFAFRHKESPTDIIIWRTKLGLNGSWSTVWLVINFIIAIGVVGWWLWIT
jgi:hypothetical protein